MFSVNIDKIVNMTDNEKKCYDEVRETVKSELNGGKVLAVTRNGIGAFKIAYSFVSDGEKVLFIDADIMSEIFLGKYKLGNGFWKKINRKMSRLVDETAFISYYTKNKFLSEGFFPRANHSVIYNSMDYDEQCVRKCIQFHISKRDNSFRFIYLGSLSEHKGVMTLLKAFSKIEDITLQLHFAGDGPLKEQVINAAKADSRIVFHGWLEETALNGILEKCDAVICPSIWPEPFGRVVLDAYKHGLPVIASRTGGLAETVEDGLTGVLFAPSNENELTTAIIKVCKDRDFYINCCLNIYDKLQQFGLDNYLDKFEELFQRAIL